MNQELAFLTKDGQEYRKVTRHGDKWLAEDVWDKIPREEMWDRLKKEPPDTEPREDEMMIFDTFGGGMIPEIVFLRRRRG